MSPIFTLLAFVFLPFASLAQEPTSPQPTNLGFFAKINPERARQILEENRAKVEQIQKTEDAAAKAKTPPAPEEAKHIEEQKQALDLDTGNIADMFPKDSGVQAAASRFATQAGDYPKALERAEKAVAADPENADALKDANVGLALKPEENAWKLREELEKIVGTKGSPMAYLSDFRLAASEISPETALFYNTMLIESRLNNSFRGTPLWAQPRFREILPRSYFPRPR